MSQWRAKHFGGLTGLVFGLLTIFFSIEKAIFLLALAAVGWCVGRVLDGEVDIPGYVRRRDID
jgi:uncharacterized membrane protein